VSQPSLCVVTPSYNQAHFLPLTIESVLGQGIEGLDYIVVDGGSTDGSVDVLRRYDGRLRWVSERDRGQADAVNKGIRATSAEIIGWINSDDVYYPGSFQAVLDAFDSSPEVDIIYGDADHIDEIGGILEPYPTEDWDLSRLQDICFICQPALFFRRRVVERFGLLDDRLQYCLDYEYWLRLGFAGVRFSRLGRRLAGSRLYATTKTLGSRRAVHREINDMFRGLVDQVPERWLSNWAHVVVDEWGIPRTERRFAVIVSLVLLVASVRWNHRLSGTVLRTAWAWMRGERGGA
jgi:glycosyltransferase involved in cell wall biosynthesis